MQLKRNTRAAVNKYWLRTVRRFSTALLSRPMRCLKHQSLLGHSSLGTPRRCFFTCFTSLEVLSSTPIKMSQSFSLCQSLPWHNTIIIHLTAKNLFLKLETSRTSPAMTCPRCSTWHPHTTGGYYASQHSLPTPTTPTSHTKKNESGASHTYTHEARYSKLHLTLYNIRNFTFAIWRWRLHLTYNIHTTSTHDHTTKKVKGKKREKEKSEKEKSEKAKSEKAKKRQKQKAKSQKFCKYIST